MYELKNTYFLLSFLLFNISILLTNNLKILNRYKASTLKCINNIGIYGAVYYQMLGYLKFFCLLK